MPDEFFLYIKSLIGSVTYVANIVFWLNTSYFSPSVDEMPLIHLWSLAVEEQFYLLFPLAMYLAFRLMKGQIIFLCLFFTVSSLIIADYSSVNHPVANFYLLPTRLFEFGFGALCAIFSLRGFVLRHSAGAILGLSAIGVAVIAFDASTRHPSFITLLPVLGTCAVILSHSPRNIVTRLLSLKPFVFIGLISYSLYLWHQPIFAFSRIRFEMENPLQFLGPILLSIALSVMSWRFVEQPFRHNPILMRSWVFGCVISVTALSLIAASAVLQGDRIIKTRLPHDVLAVFEEEGRPVFGAECHWQPGRPLLNILSTCSFGLGENRMLVVGDSHAGTLVQGFSEAVVTHPRLSITSVHAQGCPPVPGLHRLDGNSQACDLLMQQIFSPETLASFSTVIMVARWSLYYEGAGFDNSEGGRENTRFAPVDTRPYRIAQFPAQDDDERKARVGNQIRDHIQGLLDAGFTIVFVEAVPEVGWDVPRRAARHLLFHDYRLNRLSTPMTAYQARISGYQSEIDDIVHPRFIRVLTGGLFCGRADAPNRCMAIEDSTLLYSDTNHLNIHGAHRVVEKVLENLEALQNENLE